MSRKQTASSMEKNLDVNSRPPVQLSVPDPVVTSISNLADDLIPLGLENGSMMQALEVEESELRFGSEHLHADKQFKLEKEKPEVSERESSIAIDDFVIKSFNKLDFVKKELAAKLRKILSVRRQIDDVPTQPELIQYEHRFSELFVQIQEKHRQTHKLYATYNTLLEIKNLMLKETSLLNSINSQFNDAMPNNIGRSKLVESMEIIVKGTQQKLEKVQHTLSREQKNYTFLKEKYAAATMEQRLFSSLLKAFQVSTNSNKDLSKYFFFCWRERESSPVYLTLFDLSSSGSQLYLCSHENDWAMGILSDHAITTKVQSNIYLFHYILQTSAFHMESVCHLNTTRT